MRYRYCLSADFLEFDSVTDDPVVVPPHTDFPKARLLDWRRPSRTWRTTGKPATHLRPGLTLTFAAPVTGHRSFFLVEINSDLDVVGEDMRAGPANLGDPPGPWMPATPTAAHSPADPRDGRHNAITALVTDSATLATRGVLDARLWFAPSETVEDYYEIGAAFGVSGLTELGVNPRSPTNQRLVQPQQRGGSRDYPEEVNAGPAYLTDEWDVLTDSRAELTRWRRFARLGPDDAVLWDYRDGGVYLMRPTRIDIAEGATVHRIRATWRQIV